jgi:hypothetical protein
MSWLLSIAPAASRVLAAAGDGVVGQSGFERASLRNDAHAAPWVDRVGVGRSSRRGRLVRETHGPSDERLGDAPSTR